MDSYNFVLCPSYHGATLLSCLLSNHSKISAMGDTLPQKRFLEEGAATCSCGETIDRCKFWQKVIGEFNPNLVYRDKNILPMYPVVFNNEYVNYLFSKYITLFFLYSKKNLWDCLKQSCTSFLNVYENFYKFVCYLQSTSFFVDGKKDLVKISVLISMENFKSKIRIIHLIRDPRAVYYSHLRRNSPLTLDKFCRSWVAFHQRTEKLGELLPARGQYYFLRYEDLCQSPPSIMENVQNFLGVPLENLTLPNPACKLKHLIGNTMLQTFDGKIKLDTNWRNNLSEEIQMKITHLTEPFFSHFGYRE